jgi:hypothetical protein
MPAGKPATTSRDTPFAPPAIASQARLAGRMLGDRAEPLGAALLAPASALHGPIQGLHAAVGRGQHGRKRQVKIAQVEPAGDAPAC